MEIIKIAENISQTNLPILVIGRLDVASLVKALKVQSEDSLILEDVTPKIESIKEGIRFLQFKPLKSPYRLVIVENADNMTPEAGNALLKTLEEAPGSAKIILIAGGEEMVLPTINSRCRKIRVGVQREYDEPKNYLTPKHLSQISYADRFNFAKDVAEEGNAKEIITLWQVYYRDLLLSGEDVLGKLKKLSSAKGLLETNISVKLLLENILMEF